jgi:biotin carboxyl carrier protein
MRRYLDGNEIELDPQDAEVTRLPDRILVRTAEGTFSALAVRQGQRVLVSFRGRQFAFDDKVARSRGGAAGTGSGEIRAPMPGTIVDVLAVQGAAVAKGQKVLVLEAMKTQQPFLAPFDGILAQLGVQKGQQVVEDQLLAIVEPSEESAQSSGE